MFRHDPSLGIKSKFSMGKMLMGGLGATALAAPFLMGGGDEEEEVDRNYGPKHTKHNVQEIITAVQVMQVLV